MTGIFFFGVSIFQGIRGLNIEGLRLDLTGTKWVWSVIWGQRKDPKKVEFEGPQNFGIWIPENPGFCVFPPTVKVLLIGIRIYR